MLHFLQRFLTRARLTSTRCGVCGVLTDENGGLCATCAEQLSPRTGGYCPRCGEIYGDEDEPPSPCGQCRTSPPPWEALRFHGPYAGLLRDLILDYKFRGGLHHSKLLADMASAAYPDVPDAAPDLIVPVPLHRKRLLWRGFNQSAELSRILSRRLDRPVETHALTRIRNTRPQTTLGLSERKENIKKAFAAAPERIKGRRVLLVDDVYTTGATLRECAETLRRAGAAGVEILVLARAMG
ncbi:ComF family protein [Pseudodesulfovibrio cashew]|uniref:ComF family protein n=1 Tax=Pseudodesulfovibrio cashew TaxID=2678688 RepID=A0A6I6JDC5_9BACT|nr:ComF family protein [Pseudodesulfovibrio cashew]QGY38613.1 ComF family protein [Pseudodesulfovibrio cashew]